jgi:hypothetical protein
MIKYQSYNHMNSPQPLSAPQRGAKKDLPLLLPVREGGRGDEYMHNKCISQIIITYSLYSSYLIFTLNLELCNKIREHLILILR